MILTLFAYSCDSSPSAVGGTENQPTAEEIAARTEEACNFISKIVPEISKGTHGWYKWTYIFDSNGNEIARGSQVPEETSYPKTLYTLLKDYHALKAGEDYFIIDQNPELSQFTLTDEAGKPKDQDNLEKRNALEALAKDLHNCLIGTSRGDLYSGVNINETYYTFIHYKIEGMSNGRRIDKFVIDNNQNINGVIGFSYSYLESTKTEGKIKIEGNVSFAGEYAITDSQLNRILNPDSEQDSENPTDQTEPSTPTPPEDTKPLTI